ncbi:MAG: glycosyltransferase involved in cell wall biosynthesis [Lentimonas sp.]|jgi:glycosyltransferase involved in cell wall biosynthesis
MSEVEVALDADLPIEDSSVKPLVSYCLFTYKQERYIGESVDAALAQTYSPLEIIISDDCSSDRTYAIIEEKVNGYEGPHRIVINRNEKNLGIGGHISFIASLAKGDFIVTVGGDDISNPKHVELAVAAMQAYEGVYLSDFAATTINESGEILKRDSALKKPSTYCLEDFVRLRKKVSTFAPGRIIHKDVVDRFPPIDSSCPTEDTVFVLRALMLGKLRREPINVIQYRRTEHSVSSSCNIRSLSISGIINQYYRDVDHALANGILSEMDAQSLRCRIAFEDFKRQMKMQSNRGLFSTPLTRFKMKLYKCLYRFGIFVGPLKAVGAKKQA